MLNNFIYAKTKSLFEEALNNGEVLNEAIVFIEDTKEIWNHGTYFDGKYVDVSNIEESIQNIINNKADKSFVEDNYYNKSEIDTKVNNKQDKLVSGTNIKTINGESVLGSGNIDIVGEGSLKTYTFQVLYLTSMHLQVITQEELEKIQNADIVYISDGTKNIQLTSKIEDDPISFLGYDLSSYPSMVNIINVSIHKISDNIEVWVSPDSISIDDYISDSTTSYATGISEEFVDGAEIAIVENFDLLMDSVLSNIRPIILLLTNTNSDKTVFLHGPYVYNSSNDGISIKFIGEFNDLTIECVLSSENNYLSGTLHIKSILGEGNLTVTTEANVQAVDTTDEIEDVETNTYIKYVALTLTDELKAQVRENIGVDNQATVDLSNYYTKEEIDSLLGDINTILESIINS